MPDGNSPGLRECKECRDPIDPYRLAPRQPDNFVLRHPRPDTPLSAPPYILQEDGTYISTEDGTPLDQENP